MVELSSEDKLILIQHTISKFEEESTLLEKLKSILPQKDIDRGIATLIATQRVRRIGPDVLQNNVSHIGELPEIPLHIKQILDTL
jgi:hypothetical protein